MPTATASPIVLIQGDVRVGAGFAMIFLRQILQHMPPKNSQSGGPRGNLPETWETGNLSGDTWRMPSDHGRRPTRRSKVDDGTYRSGLGRGPQSGQHRRYNGSAATSGLGERSPKVRIITLRQIIPIEGHSLAHGMPDRPCVILSACGATR